MTSEFKHEAYQNLHVEQEVVNVFVAGEEPSGKCSLIKRFANREIQKTTSKLKCVVKCLYTLTSSAVVLRIWYVHNLYGAMDSIKEICNHQKSVILFCYSSSYIDTLASLLVQWIPEIKEQIGTSVPALLVENENNLKISEPEDWVSEAKHFVSTEDEHFVMQRFLLNGFLRCSLNDIESVERVFHAAVTFAS
ncbi:hypothetical protein AVEN_86817-1 [Araneus ventricosus]|uniref:Uncharacterized protein n=1 Tax=Araneus ventricosus TaxID=182803 RepID=A0A4Y2D1S4_ARAVE|nr:hypothetical protein AVEN_86817-1 [Araneus ventricosus]